MQPIKIISTPSSDGKQLQVVPVKPASGTATHSHPEPKPETKPEANASTISASDAEAQNYRNKERLMANLQLQSTSKAHSMEIEKMPHVSRTHNKIYDNAHISPKGRHQEEEGCVYEYEEPDRDEILEFAAKRDREWALQKQLDEEEREKHRLNKKRKKSKHSKGNLLYKKRKLHAEITSSEALENEDSLKLKVKLTSHNGYKVKHHRSSSANQFPGESSSKRHELSSKEKLLQMRQVRHKHISSSDEKVNANPTAHLEEKPAEGSAGASTHQVEHKSSGQDRVPTPKSHDNGKAQSVKPEVMSSSPGKTLRSDFANKTKELCVKMEHSEAAEKQAHNQAQKTFLKTFQSYTEKLSQKNAEAKTEPKVNFEDKPKAPPIAKSNANPAKPLEQKIANLHQISKVEKKDSAPAAVKEKKPPTILNSQFPSGFTVSKIENGVKRKSEDRRDHDKRPSLEITLVNPNPSPSRNHVQKNAVEHKNHTAKRPPPPTIPLERIKKSINLKSGISIIPKLPDR